MKSKLKAIIFCLFLGGFGAHKFYIGNKKTGVLYLIFSWTLIPAILAIIDLLLLITMSDKKFQSLCMDTHIIENKSARESLKLSKNILSEPETNSGLEDFMSSSGLVGKSSYSLDKRWKVVVAQDGALEIENESILKYRHKIKGASGARISNNGRTVVLINGGSSIKGHGLNSEFILLDGQHIDSLVGEPALVIDFDISPGGNTIVYSLGNSSSLKNKIRIKGMKIDQRAVLKFERQMPTTIKFISETQIQTNSNEVFDLSESVT